LPCAARRSPPPISALRRLKGEHGWVIAQETGKAWGEGPLK
jgi:hypothetical protein